MPESCLKRFYVTSRLDWYLTSPEIISSCCLIIWGKIREKRYQNNFSKHKIQTVVYKQTLTIEILFEQDHTYFHNCYQHSQTSLNIPVFLKIFFFEILHLLHATLTANVVYDSSQSQAAEFCRGRRWSAKLESTAARKLQKSIVQPSRFTRVH